MASCKLKAVTKFEFAHKLLNFSPNRMSPKEYSFVGNWDVLRIAISSLHQDILSGADLRISLMC